MTTSSDDFDAILHHGLDIVKAHIGDFRPDCGVILGSGLGDFGASVKAMDLPFFEVSYADLPGFPMPHVEGHKGALLFVRLGQTNLVIAQGRSHYYEQGNAAVMKPIIALFKALGASLLIATNAAGSLDDKAQPGSVMILSDHINMTGTTPLMGEKGNARFVDMVNAYDTDIRTKFRSIAIDQGIDLHEGVYLWATGPQFETPAEIRAFRILGADAVGMSTVPEVIMARHVGLKVAAFSIITNMGAGISDENLSHEHTQTIAKQAASSIRTLLLRFFEQGL